MLASDEEEIKIKEIKGNFSEKVEGTIICTPVDENLLDCEINTDKMKGKLSIKLK